MLRANERIGPYQLINKLGKGGFGEVWLARNAVALAAREVALKIPLDDNVDLDVIRQEAAIWIKASGHPNVLPIIEANVYEDYVVIASEYAPDGSLEDWLRNHGGRAPSVEAAVEMTRGILAGLEYLHSRQIIHRDMKPANILLQGATPRITDFGISRVFKSTSQSAVMAGTPAYMAPEAFNRKRNQQTDLWSVGVILYQMLTGHLPFGGNDLAELYGAILNDEPILLSGITSERLRQVVAKALAKDPARRYQSAAEMRANLMMPLHANEVGAQPPRVVVTPPQPQPKPQLQNEAPSTVLRSQTIPRPGIQSPLDSESVRPASKGDAPFSEQHRTRVTRVAAPAGDQFSTLETQRRRSITWFIVAAISLAIIAGVIYLATQMPHSSISKALPDYGPAFTENLNGVNLEMIRVPGGSYLMGSPESEQGRKKDEGPQHKVTVQSFYIGKYEVTRAQWKAVMGNDPSTGYKNDDDAPVDTVSWYDAKEFCKKLSKITGKRFLLPSEAEWEYACRAGTTGAYAGKINAMAWYNIGGGPFLIGQKQPNAFGLYDMHGNVGEWCEDTYHSSYSGQQGNSPSDGSAWNDGSEQDGRVIRGGAFNNGEWDCRSAARLAWNAPNVSYGLRVVVSARTR